MTKQQSNRSGLVLWAAMGTIVLALAGIALVGFHLLDNASGRSIEDAPQTPLTPTLVSALGMLLAAGWALWLVRTRGSHDLSARIVSGIAVVLLVVTAFAGWQARGSERNLTIVTTTCNAESLRNIGGDVRTGCSEDAVETIVLLGAVRGDQAWVPDTITGNLTRQFINLPAGSWQTRLTVDGPADTVSVVVIAERDGEPVRLGTLRPHYDAATARLRWSGVVPVAADVSSLQVQFYLSPNPAVTSARIRFDVRACTGQSIRTFDAAGCEPMDAGSPFIFEQPPEGARTWRQLHVSGDGDSYVVSNLEARTYTLQPDYVNIEKTTQSTDVLIIPAAMEQVAANSITAPGESSFDLQIDDSTGELVYVIYVFPTGPTFAHSAGNAAAT